MRDKDTFSLIDDVGLIFKYLYCNPSHYVVTHNGPQLKIYMDSDCNIWVVSLEIPNDKPTLLQWPFSRWVSLALELRNRVSTIDNTMTEIEVIRYYTPDRKDLYSIYAGDYFQNVVDT